MLATHFLFLLLASCASARTTTNHTDQEVVHDKVMPLRRIDEQSLLTSGGALPDWSDAKMESPRYVEILLAVDAGVDITIWCLYWHGLSLNLNKAEYLTIDVIEPCTITVCGPLHTEVSCVLGSTIEPDRLAHKKNGSMDTKMLRWMSSVTPSIVFATMIFGSGLMSSVLPISFIGLYEVVRPHRLRKSNITCKIDPDSKVPWRTWAPEADEEDPAARETNAEEKGEEDVQCNGKKLVYNKDDYSTYQTDRKAPYWLRSSYSARYYGHENEKIRAAMLMLMHAVNMYAFQLGIRITVVDVVPVHGYNVTLEQFLEWRHTTDNLAAHDMAILVRHRYEGGIAYVDGVCKRTAVGIAGFFPEAPHEYASVFFHEIAHLLGLSHSARADCHCSKKNRASCLRIDGFDNDCSAQALIDLLPSIECLAEPKQVPRTSLPLCGNGFVEEDEDCDCGPARYCNNALCDSQACRFIIARQYLYTSVTFGAALIICGFIAILRRTISNAVDIKTNLVDKAPPAFPPPHKPMLYGTDSPPNELAPGYIPSTHTIVHTSRISPSPANLQLPTKVRTPVRPAPKRPGQLTLESAISVPKEPVIPSDYVPMNPPKNLLFEQKITAKRPSAAPPSRPVISDPIPIIVAGRNVNEQTRNTVPSTLQIRPSNILIDAIGDATTTQLLDKTLSTSTLSKPPLPNRMEKPALRFCTNERSKVRTKEQVYGN